MCVWNFACYFNDDCVRKYGAEEDFIPEREENAGGWRKLPGKEKNDLFYSPYIVRVNKSRMMWLAGHMAGTWEKRNEYKMFSGKPDRKRQFGRPGRQWVGDIKWIVKKLVMVMWTKLVLLAIIKYCGSFYYSNEISSYLKFREFLY